MPYFGEQKREYDRLRVAQCRAAWFENKACVKCGSTENLENHHIDPSTKISHNVWTWSAERRAAELAKCEILCYDCHLVETILQTSKHLVHGTLAGYRKHKCRCEKCVQEASKRRNEQRRTGGRKHQKSYKPK